jgi:hypothetical protein
MAEFQAPTQQEFDAITRRTALTMKRQLLAVLPGLENAAPDDLREIDVEGGGYGLHVARLDADISIPALLADQLGSTIMRRAIARANASRSNGRMGGRPRKPKAA